MASPRCRSTDTTFGCGPGTSLRCRARVVRRRGRARTAAAPAGCATGVPAGCATGVPGAVGPARPLAGRAASFVRRVGSKPGQAPRPRRRSPHWWRMANPGQALRPRRRSPHWWRMANPGQAPRPRRRPPHWWRMANPGLGQGASQPGGDSMCGQAATPCLLSLLFQFRMQFPCDYFELWFRSVGVTTF